MKNYLKSKRQAHLMAMLQQIKFLRGINTSKYSLVVSALVNGNMAKHKLRVTSY